MYHNFQHDWFIGKETVYVKTAECACMQTLLFMYSLLRVQPHLVYLLIFHTVLSPFPFPFYKVNYLYRNICLKTIVCHTYKVAQSHEKHFEVLFVFCQIALSNQIPLFFHIDVFLLVSSNKGSKYSICHKKERGRGEEEEARRERGGEQVKPHLKSSSDVQQHCFQ